MIRSVSEHDFVTFMKGASIHHSGHGRILGSCRAMEPKGTAPALCNAVRNGPSNLFEVNTADHVTLNAWG